MKTPKMQEKFAQERESLGLPPSTCTETLAPFEEAWENDDLKAEMLREQKEAWEALKEKDERFMQHVKTRWEPKDKKEWTEKLEHQPIIRDPKLVASFSDV